MLFSSGGFVYKLEISPWIRLDDSVYTSYHVPLGDLAGYFPPRISVPVRFVSQGPWNIPDIRASGSQDQRMALWPILMRFGSPKWKFHFKGGNSMAKGFGFASTAAMRTARTSAAAVLLTDVTKALVTGGATSDGPFSAELYDDNTASWTPSEMTTARSGHAATLLKSGHVLVVGGDNSVDPATAEVYSPNTNSWQKVFNNLNAPRIAHTATLLPDGRVLVTGGSGAGGGPSLSSAEIFDPGNDPVNGSWTSVNPMNDARAFHTATLLPDGMVLVAGGTTGGAYLSSAELFDPATGVWSRTSPMNDAHAGHTATLLTFDPLLEFMVLVAGGFGSFGDITSVAELYNPPPPVVLPAAGGSPASTAGGSWVQVGPMNVTRMFHTATLLPASGALNRTRQVLVTGGPDPGNEITTGKTTEIYDSATRAWTLTGNLHSDRTGHTATMLPGGKVLVAGGGDNSAEIGTGCNASAQIVVSPPQTMDFGQVQAGSEFNNSNFLPTVQNTGNALLTLTAAISGPDAALFLGPSALALYASAQTGPCVSGPSASGPSQEPVFVQFDAWSPVPKTCQATLTLGGSNAANVPAGQTWVFPMIAQIVVSANVGIEIAAPSFPGEVGVGDTETGQLVISLVLQPSEAVSAVVRFPPSPLNGSFHWTARDYIIRAQEPPVSVPIAFTPRAPGPVSQTLELISNAQSSPNLVLLRGTGRKGIVP
jgi:hypothetical protein